MSPYRYIAGRIPLLISIPHAGLSLTEEVKQCLSNDAMTLPDTDWHVEQLYQFAQDIGAHIIVANYSRFVIDLNRPADDQPLYQTATTGLFPQTLFNGVSIFKQDQEPGKDHRDDCLTTIWQPYHQKIQDVLNQFKENFGYAVLFDAHSIASHIPRLFTGQLPDLNLGTNDSQSCLDEAEQELKKVCDQQDQYSWVINGRFKGGYITRAYGVPEQHQHAIQLELAQRNYMQEQPPYAFDTDKAKQLIPVLETIVKTYYQSITRHYG
jgi:formiminoglutamase